jgi:hypothetical protein
LRVAIVLVLVGGQSAIAPDDGGVDVAHDARVCPQPTELAEGWPIAIAVDATDVYWLQSEPYELVRTPKTGGTNTLLATDVSAFTLDADTVIYGGVSFEGGISNQILTLPKAGGSPTVIVTTTAAVEQLFADATTIYFVIDGAVNAVAKTGGTPQPITSGPYASSLVGVDDTSAYWISSETTSATIWSTPKGGGPSVQLAQRGVIMRAVLDSGAIYFTTDARDLEKLVIATSAITVLATGLGTYGGEALAVQSGTAFVNEQDMGQYPAIILAAPANGGVVDTCAGGSMAVTSIAADEATLYWSLVYEGFGQVLSKPR